MSLLVDRGPDPASGNRPARVVPLGEADRPDLLRLIDADPLVNVVADARLRGARNLDVGSLGASILGVREAGVLRAAALNGANLQPVGGGPDDWSAIGRHLRTRGRVCSSIVGRADAVAGVWAAVHGAWGAPRAVRAAQPLLVIDRHRLLRPADPRVRPMRMADLDRYLPAAAAMFTEELGVSPVRSGMQGEYRRRIAGTIAAGRAFGIVDGHGSVVFKADLGAVSARTCQVQGVWVRPDLRGQGLATAAMVAVLHHALDLAPTASLYVNDFNLPARRVYERIGMTESAVVSTVLF